MQSLPICTSASFLLWEDLVKARASLSRMCRCMRPNPAGVAGEEESGRTRAWCPHSRMHQCSYLLLNDCHQKVATEELLSKSGYQTHSLCVESCRARHKSPHLKALESDLNWLSRSLILMQLYCSQATHVACLPILQLKQDNCQPVLCGLLAAVNEGSQACLWNYTSL